MAVWQAPDTVAVTVRNGAGEPSAPLSFTFTAAAARESAADAPRRTREPR